MKLTLEEVKEYFKDAEIVESLYGNKFENKYKFNYSNENDGIYANDGGFQVWGKDRGYAKILTYKKQKFEITKEQILQLSKYTSLANDWFPDVFKKELVVGKWYKWTNDGFEIKLFVTEIDKENEAISGYGFRSKQWIDSGIWYKGRDYFNDAIKGFTEATPQEVETALKNEWIKNNKNIFKIDNSNICELGGKYKISNNPSYRYWEANNMFTVDEVCVFLNGKFANVIEIETITIQEAEKLLNKKIV